MVPLIPLPLRPKRGLENYHVLWEAEWTGKVPLRPDAAAPDRPRRFVARRRRLDPTEVERAALATRVARMNALHDNTDLDKCLCCGQPVSKRGNPITPQRPSAPWRSSPRSAFVATIFSASTVRSSTISRRASPSGSKAGAGHERGHGAQMGRGLRQPRRGHLGRRYRPLRRLRRGLHEPAGQWRLHLPVQGDLPDLRAKMAAADRPLRRAAFRQIRLSGWPAFAAFVRAWRGPNATIRVARGRL